MAYLSQLHDLPEIVREARLNAEFHAGEDQRLYTVHTRGRAVLGREDIWIHQKNLGRGGFGSVDLQVKHSARPGPAQLRAVKSIAISEREIKANPKFYVRELETILKFSQAGYNDLFVNTHGWFTSDNSLFIAMEYFEHGDLQKYLSSCENRRIPEYETREIASQILDALSRMHDENFSHRDLKPQNILIRSLPPEPWVVKLGDFGISKRVGEAATTTQVTTIRGTPGFAAPELNDVTLRTEGKLDLLASDMWCFGETIYRLLSGQPTFENPRALYKYVYGGDKFPGQTLRDLQVSEQAIAFLDSVIKPKPSERATANEALTSAWLMDPSLLGASLSSLSLAGSRAVTPKPWESSSTPGTTISLGEVTDGGTAVWPTAIMGGTTGSLGSPSGRGSLVHETVASWPSMQPPDSWPETEKPLTAMQRPADQTAAASAVWPTEIVSSNAPLAPTQQTNASPATWPATTQQAPSTTAPSEQTVAPTADWSTVTRPQNATTAGGISQQTVAPTVAWPTTTAGMSTTAQSAQRTSAPSANEPTTVASASTVMESPAASVTATAPTTAPAPSPQQSTTQSRSEASDVSPERLQAREVVKEKTLQGNQHYNNGEWAAAHRLFADALEHRKLEPGYTKDPETLDCTHLIAYCLKMMGRLEDSKEMYKWTVQQCEIVHGPYHSDTLLATQSLASVYYQSNDYDNAETYHRNLLEVSKSVWSDNPTKYLEVVYGLASTLYQQAKYTEAEPFYFYVVEEKTRLGMDGVDDSLIPLAGCRGQMMRFDEAEVAYQQAYEYRKRVYGDSNENTITVMKDLATFLDQVNKDEAAERVYKEIWAMRKKVYGAKHGMTLAAQKEYDDFLARKYWVPGKGKMRGYLKQLF